MPFYSLGLYCQLQGVNNQYLRVILRCVCVTTDLFALRRKSLVSRILSRASCSSIGNVNYRRNAVGWIHAVRSVVEQLYVYLWSSSLCWFQDLVELSYAKFSQIEYCLCEEWGISKTPGCRSMLFAIFVCLFSAFVRRVQTCP